MRQIFASEWVRGDYNATLVLPFSWEALESKLDFTFEDCYEEGWGPTKIAGAKLASGRQISFQCLLWGRESETIVYSLFDPKPDYKTLSELLYRMRIWSENLVWECPLIEHEGCRLCRVDDNNNEFTVGDYQWESDAKLKMDELTKFPHKQHYWIEVTDKSASPKPVD